MKPSLVLWDWNGTLLDDVALCVDALNRLLRIYHYPQQYSLAQYREIFGFPIEDYYIRAGFDFSKNSYKELADDYMQDYLARAGACPLAESAVPALSLLKVPGCSRSFFRLPTCRFWNSRSRSAECAPTLTACWGWIIFTPAAKWKSAWLI